MILPKLNIKWERWKFNKDFGVYVSTLGHFKDRYKRDIPIKINQHGYCIIKTEQGLRLAHRLVMMTWCPTDDAENLTVDHLNHNKRDNSLANLEWVTKEVNWERARNDRCVEPKKVKEKNKHFIGVFNKDGSVNFTFETEEEFVDFLLNSTKKKVKRTKEQLIEYVKTCKKTNKEFELLGYKWKRGDCWWLN